MNAAFHFLAQVLVHLEFLNRVVAAVDDVAGDGRRVDQLFGRNGRGHHAGGFGLLTLVRHTLVQRPVRLVLVQQERVGSATRLRDDRAHGIGEGRLREEMVR